MSTVAFRQTAAPSRSKQGGPCWIAIDGTYAAETSREVEADVDAILSVTGKVTLRRATRTSTDRAEWKIRVTGDPTDSFSLSLGSPQSVAVEITGAVRA